MIKFSDISIKRKIIIIVLAITIVSLGLGATWGIYSSISSFKEELLNRMQVSASIIGDYIVSDIEFNFPEATNSSLEKLSKYSNIKNVIVFKNDSTLFAQYNQVGFDDYNLKYSDKGVNYYRNEYLYINHIIYSKPGSMVGTIAFRISTEELQQRIESFILSMFGLFVLIAAFSIFVGVTLSKKITNPILSLVDIMQKISKEEDYSIRAEKVGNDEVGTLYDGFNSMLEQIVNRETERDLALDSLSKSEENFKNIFNSSHDAIFIHDIDGNVLSVNDTMLSMYEVTKEEASNYSIIDYSASNNAMEGLSNIWQEVIDGNPKEFDWLAKRPHDNSEFFVQVNLKKIVLVTESFIMATVRDITIEKEAQNALLASEEKYRSLVEHSLFGVFITDDKYKFKYANEGLAQILEYSVDELIGSDFRKVVEKESLELVLNYYHRRRKGEKVPTRYEYVIVRKSGEKRWVEINPILIKDSMGNSLTIAQMIDITEEKKAKDALIASENKLKAMFKSLPVGVGIISSESRKVLEVNDRALAITKLLREDVIGFDVKRLYKYKEQYIEVGKKLLRKEYNVGTEINWITGDGNDIVVLLNLIPFSDGNVLVSFIDITEERKTKDALIESENKLQTLFKMLPVGVGIIRNREIYEVNNKALEITGYSLEDILGKSTRILYKSEADFITTGKMFYESQSLFVEHEVEWKKKNGDIITILLGLVPLFPEEKNSELVFTFIDITEEKKAKDALIASENKLNTMFKVLPVGVGIIQDRVITVTNNEAEVITGYTKEEIIGQNVRILYKNEKQFLEAGKQLYQNNFKGGVELNWLKKDGKEEIFVYINIMPLSNDIVHGEMLFSFIDITSLKNAEKEIRILNEELEERVKKRTAQLEAANRELEAFSYSVSHDLRAPLRSIDGFSLALFEDYSDVLDDEGKTFILRVRSGAQRMSRLIDDMLKLSRTTRGELKITKFKIDELVNSIINTIKDSNIGTKAEFVVSADIEVFADITLLRSVLENLLGNAFKFTSKIKMPQIAFGYFSKEIAFDKFNINRDVFFVKDNGAGFDMEYVDKIFGAFQRLHKEAEFEGTGIGLASVQRIINRHGGKIWAEGEVNKGATFYFTLN